MLFCITLKSTKHESQKGLATGSVMRIVGLVSSGLGRAHVFMAQKHYQEQFQELMDTSVWPGTHVWPFAGCNAATWSYPPHWATHGLPWPPAPARLAPPYVHSPTAHLSAMPAPPPGHPRARCASASAWSPPPWPGPPECCDAMGFSTASIPGTSSFFKYAQ